MTTTYKMVETGVRVIDTITCNRCGLDCRSLGNIEGLGFYESWGYGSHKDCEIWNGILCEACSDLFEKWIESAGGHIDKQEVTVWGDPISLDKEN